MIHVFNRAELMLTQDLQELNRIRSLLEKNRIPYRIKSNTTLASSAVRDGRPGNVMGINGTAIMYTIYVQRKDLEHAAYLIK